MGPPAGPPQGVDHPVLLVRRHLVEDRQDECVVGEPLGHGQRRPVSRPAYAGCRCAAMMPRRAEMSSRGELSEHSVSSRPKSGTTSTQNDWKLVVP